MKPAQFDGVRVILRGQAAGGITQADVLRRARELSLIRTGNEAYAAEDLEAAQRELMVGDDPASMTDDAESVRSANRDPSDPIVDAGMMHERTEAEDENTVPEKLALQGLQEAQHDQMVEAQELEAEDLGSDEAPSVPLRSPNRTRRRKPVVKKSAAMKPAPE